MNLRQLKSFLAVADELNFVRAANRLNMTQPALSQQIRALESELGIILLDRGTRPTRLTEAGDYFQGEARCIVNRYTDAISGARQVDARRRSWLGIGFTRSAMYSILPSVLREFSKLHPEVELKLYEMLAEAQPEALRLHTIQLGIGRDPLNDSHLKSEVLLRERLVVAMSSTHRLSKARSVDAKDLTDEPFILFPKDPRAQFHDIVRAICSKAGFIPYIAHYTAEIQTALALASAGLGITLVASTMTAYCPPKLVYRALKTSDKGNRSSLVVLSRPDERSPLTALMLELLRKEACGYVSRC